MQDIDLYFFKRYNTKESLYFFGVGPSGELKAPGVSMAHPRRANGVLYDIGNVSMRQQPPRGSLRCVRAPQSIATPHTHQQKAITRKPGIGTPSGEITSHFW